VGVFKAGLRDRQKLNTVPVPTSYLNTALVPVLALVLFPGHKKTFQASLFVHFFKKNMLLGIKKTPEFGI